MSPGAPVSKPSSAEMHGGPGFRIRTSAPAADAETIAGLADFDTPSVSDLMNRLYTMSTGIRILTAPESRLIGPACTVKVFPGDNLMVHKSLDIARPGDVVVIDSSASSLTAVLGDLISTKARHRGIVGFVVDGHVRDIDAIRALGDFPVFARGVTPIGPLHRGPGEINHPIAAGGIVVHPGDIVVGDINGVVVVPRDCAATILERLRSRRETDAEYQKAVARGEFSNDWVDRVLDSAGVEIDEGRS